MRKDYWELISKFNDGLVTLDEKVAALESRVSADEEWLFDHCEDIFELEVFLEKIPQEFSVLAPEEALEFAHFLARVYQIPFESFKRGTIAVINETTGKQLAIILNEITFVAKVIGNLPELDTSLVTPQWLQEIPQNLRSTKEVKQYISDLLVDLGVTEKCFEAEVEGVEGYLNFLHEVYGLEQKVIIELSKKMDQLLTFTEQNIHDLEIEVNGRTFNVNCSDEYFFITYFTHIFKKIYSCTKPEAQYLMTGLFDAMFGSSSSNEGSSLFDSLDLEEVIKKRLLRETKRWSDGGYSNKKPSKKGVDSLIIKLADYRIARISKAL